MGLCLEAPGKGGHHQKLDLFYHRMPSTAYQALHPLPFKAARPWYIFSAYSAAHFGSFQSPSLK